MSLFSFNILTIVFPDETGNFVQKFNAYAAAPNSRGKRRALLKSASIAAAGLMASFFSFVAATLVDITLVFHGHLPMILPTLVTGASLLFSFEFLQILLTMLRSSARIVRTKSGYWEFQDNS